MVDIPTIDLQAQLDRLRAARATGARRVEFGNEDDRRVVEYRSDIELREAILDLERRIAGVSARTVRLASSKGL